MIEPTWGWGELVEHARETDTGLRRKIQRGEVPNFADTGRTAVSLWDIAAIRLMRHLGDCGADVQSSYKLAETVLGRAYKPLIKGVHTFNKQAGEQQEILFLVARREGRELGGWHLVSIDPAAPEKGKDELLLQISDPRNIIVPVQALLSDCWYSLPNLPDNVAAWLRAANANMKKLGLTSEGRVK